MEDTKYIFEKGSEPQPCEMYIDFSVFSSEDDFKPSELTQILGIEPKIIYHKGDLIHNNLYRKETCWHLETSRIKTQDLEDVFKELLTILKEKIPVISEYVTKHKLSVKIYPVIVVYNNMPSIVITKEIQGILHLLNAVMEFDMYFAN
jgi:hypothetical protein